MSLPYFAADTLGMTLYQVNGHLESTEFRKLPWDGWKLDVKFEAVSDALNIKASARELTFWVKVHDRIPCYVIVRERESWFFVFDPVALKPLLKSYDGDTLEEMITAVKPAMKRAFRWKGDIWQTVAYHKGLLFS